MTLPDDQREFLVSVLGEARVRELEATLGDLKTKAEGDGIGYKGGHAPANLDTLIAETRRLLEVAAAELPRELAAALTGLAAKQSRPMSFETALKTRLNWRDPTAGFVADALVLTHRRGLLRPSD